MEKIDKIMKMKIASLKKEKCRYNDYKGRWELVGNYNRRFITDKDFFNRVVLSDRVIYSDYINTNLGRINYYIIKDNYEKFNLIEEFDFDIYSVRCLFISNRVDKVFEYFNFYYGNIRNVNLIYNNKELKWI